MKRLLLVLLSAVGCQQSGAFRPLQPGDAAPGYAVFMLAGDTVSLDRFKGQAVLLNVWATWCVPCKEEMPAFQRLHSAWADSGLRIVGVSVDAPGADAEIRRFVEEHRLAFTIAKDPARRIDRAFRTIGVPETFLIDSAGKVQRRWIGQFDPEDSTVIAEIRRALGRPATS